MKILHVVFLGVVALLTACASPKEVLYLQDVDPLKVQNIDQKYEVIIHSDDMLSIMVNCKDEELALPFNMPLITYQMGSSTNYTGQQRVLGYLVNTKGDIDFPILGTIHAEGMTRAQLTEFIKNKLVSGNYIKDPLVTVQFLNFKVSVMGEVARPGSFNITGDRITLLEALSMAGDLTIYGRRDRVAVIREKDGHRTILYHDLRSSDIFKSPCYYLQQNDIVYVEPNKARAGQSSINQNNSASVWLSAISVISSLAAIIVTITK
jgi:protein involved in polysaccharide export with SLBB domain